uniref:Uncharacterized protein n=1 Tax=Cucumis melo TaxID=3656 RepID=A0A9I9DJK8_CUCME
MEFGLWWTDLLRRHDLSLLRKLFSTVTISSLPRARRHSLPPHTSATKHADNDPTRRHRWPTFNALNPRRDSSMPPQSPLRRSPRQTMTTCTPNPSQVVQI